MNNELIHANITEIAIRNFYAVYNELGSGFVEAVYEKAMLVALAQDGVKVQSQVPLEVKFRNVIVGEFRADLLLEKVVVIEVKAVAALLPVHDIQLVNYLKATGLSVGLLFNFGSRPTVKRRVLSHTARVQPARD